MVTATPLAVALNAEIGADVELRVSSYVRTIAVPEVLTVELTSIGP